MDTRDGKEKIIVLCEDNADIGDMLSMRLEVSGYKVIRAMDGEEGMDKIRVYRPDLILTDLMMPGITGFELCRMVRFDDELRDIPIIVLSALDRQREREKAIEAGADSYFIKPFDLDLLVKKIRDLIAEEQ